MFPASKTIDVETRPHDDRSLRDEENRIFAHGMHVENGVLQRGNYFLLVESMLIVAYSVLVSAEGVHAMAARVICALGFVLAFAWIYVSWSATRYMVHLIRLAEARLPEYRQTRASMPRRPIQTSVILNYLVPGLIAAMWSLLFIVA